MDVALLIPLVPLAGWLLNGLVGARLPRAAAGGLACAAVAASFAAAVQAWGALPAVGEGTAVAVSLPLYRWLGAGDLWAEASLLVDRLSLVMALLVSGVSFLIHVYSLGYMAAEPHLSRYFAYLNLFTSAMLLLVLAGNLLVLFVGWELVGVCSYLLIGFWFERPAAAAAGRKAFVVNRIGDAAFLLGLCLLFVTLGTLDIAKIREGVAGLPAARTAAALLLFTGAVGKSAQLPLHVWLPDAMEGPTPVSALIHAATMVTAGVFLIARLDRLFLTAPGALPVVGMVGALTAFFAATVALREWDLKRVLAYSTISQLGYMFLAMGVLAPAAGIFHLVTHAFFKALLFLAAGAVMHAMHDVVDMRRLGGLAGPLRRTAAGFAVGALALAGVPPFAGFFSKDLILERAFAVGQATGNYAPYALGLLTAFVTAVYVARAWLLVFTERPASRGAHPHEAPPVMLWPMAVLAVLSLAGGLLGARAAGAPLLRVLEPILRVPVAPEAHPPAALLAVVSVGVAAAGLLTGARLHRGRRDPSLGTLGAVLEARWYVDTLYDRVIVRPGGALARFLAGPVDLGAIDAAVNGTGRVLARLGAVARALQTGYARQYALAVLVGTLIILGTWMLR
ncbi:MAG: NADH-quinone oxidoreductase subunit L [Armatimonadota bacterium]|nr:NADH-quinone oxidoreductase subunit L [Armatimonadota bacterium]MDR7533189.1 NADH-quinone oxidoreductase subunit L [Armatimonadota bacterium]MDR7535423.1 NADH-quinone oxidoreductase subunit L [Armatimonadota bacterium]